MIKTKKLSFSAVTVRQLTQNMTEEELRGVAGGTVLANPATGRCAIQIEAPPNGAVTLGGPRPLTTQCPSVAQTLGAC